MLANAYREVSPHPDPKGVREKSNFGGRCGDSMKACNSPVSGKLLSSGIRSAGNHPGEGDSGGSSW